MHVQLTRLACIIALLALPLASACGAASPPVDQEGNVAGQPQDAPAKLKPDADVNQLLDALHDVGRDLRTLQASVVLTDIDNVSMNETKRPGDVFLSRDDQSVRFRAVFRGVLVEVDGKPGLRPEKIEYVLRGDELIDRNYKSRTQVTRKLPPDNGKRDLLKLGEGPFPLPIGQPRQEVLKQFDVRSVDPADPRQNEMEVAAAPGTRRLRLTPLEGAPLSKSFAWIEIDVALADGMPAKVITLDKTGDNARVTELRSIKINQPLPEGALEPEPIDARQWNIMVEELPQQASLTRELV